MRSTVTTLALALVLGTSAFGSPQEAPPPAAPPAAAPAPQAPELAPAPDAPRTFYEKVRVSFDGKADTPGVVGLEAQPSGGAAKRVWVRVLPKTKADDVAELVAKELTFALGAAYKVKASGGRVTVGKASKASAPVCVTVAGMSIYGVSVVVEQD